MRFRLPSIHALRAFEAAARLGAFNKAAEELGLSATAISHHIRGLETDLGIKLFVRSTRKINLTDDGRLLANVCTESFQSLGEVVETLRNNKGRRSVIIALGPLLASRWLTPRLDRFWEKFPDIDLQMLHTSLRVDPKAISADIYLAWGDGRWSALGASPFLKVSMVPVASPEYFEKYGRPQKIHQMFTHHLIHQRSKSGWNEWLAHHDLKLPPHAGGIVIEDANVVVRTAISGKGIALGWLPLVEDEIASGKLVPFFGIQPSKSLGYHLIKAPGRNPKPEIEQVVKWLNEESRRSSTGD